MHCSNVHLATSTVEIYTVVRINLFTYLLKSSNVILFRLLTTCLAYRIDIPDRMTKPRTKNGFVDDFDVRGVNNFLVGIWQNDTL